MMKRLRSRPHHPEDPHINLTPLIDVVFVILILFMVIAPLLHVDTVHLAKSGNKAKPETSQGEHTLTIHVNKQNEISCNTHPVSLEHLPILLRKNYALNPTVTPKLFHDKEAHFGTYQAVKNAVELAGFAELDVILEPGSPSSPS